MVRSSSQHPTSRPDRAGDRGDTILTTQVIIVETTKTCDAVRRRGQVRLEKASKSGRHHTTIVGNLVDDPELRFTNNGTAVASLRVAVIQRIQHDGEWRDGDTSFLRVNVWRGQAEHLADSLAKGDRVMVTGRLRQRSWETPRATSARSPRSRPTRSAPASSGPPPRSNAPANAATATAPRAESEPLSAAATSTTHRPFRDQ
jgi:single-strand DNA-binding protein